ncbi:MAG: hypothetical protein V5A88_05255 [Candidatus Thermoplasmatota archaeon]
MEMEVILLFALYGVYYIAFPLTLIIIAWKILNKKNSLVGTTSFGTYRKKDPTLEDEFRGIKKLQVLLVILLLLFMPVMNLTSSSLSDRGMKRDRIFFGAFGQSRVYDPVNEKIGPTMDVDSVIEQMEESYEEWYLEYIQDEIDFEKLSRIPGRLAAYHLTKKGSGLSYIVITYHYFSPLPVTKVIGFEILETAESEFASLGVEKTIVYPLNPAAANSF